MLVFDLQVLASLLEISKDQLMEVEFSAMVRGAPPKVNDPFIISVWYLGNFRLKLQMIRETKLALGEVTKRKEQLQRIGRT